jgi:hypothetical protein
MAAARAVGFEMACALLSAVVYAAIAPTREFVAA